MVDGSLTRKERQIVGHNWGVAAFGPEETNSMPQRGIRLAEESFETCQVCGVDPKILHKLIDRVYSKPVGDLHQELGGVGLTLLILAKAAGIDADQAEADELRRVLSKPLAHFAERNRLKNEAGLLQIEADPATALKVRPQDHTPPTSLTLAADIQSVSDELYERYNQSGHEDRLMEELAQDLSFCATVAAELTAWILRLTTATPQEKAVA